MNKKLTFIGRGLAGSLTIFHFIRWTDWEIEWIYDPNIAVQSVGEGTTLDIPKSMYINFGFNAHNLAEVDGSLKLGIWKKNWGKTGKEFIHEFPPGACSYHYNSLKLQDFIMKKVKKYSKVKVIEANVPDHDSLDSDFIMNCTGRPTEYHEYILSKSIPVNSVLATQCFWEGARFQYTLAIARPYGWIFCIPLQNRCSVGYMYNNEWNSLEDITKDTKEFCNTLNLNPSNVTQSFSFKSYFKKNVIDNRVVYNGNKAFFLEPLEATSLSYIEYISRNAYDYWNENKNKDILSNDIFVRGKEYETLICLHYLAGSIYDTVFWKKSKEMAIEHFEEQINNAKLIKILENSFIPAYADMLSPYNFEWESSWGTFTPYSFEQNIKGLELSEYIKNYINRSKIHTYRTE
jgi:hypothetical protein